MLHIGDKVTISGWGDRIFTITQISDNDGAIKYRGFDYEYMIPSDLHEESDMTVAEHTTEPNTITVRDDVLVSQYSDIRVIQESNGTYRASEWIVEPETPVHGIVTVVNGSAYQAYRVILDDGTNAEVEAHYIKRASDYTLF